MTLDEVLTRLRALSRPENLASLARFGIATDRALAVSIPDLRRLARAAGTDHDLALALWATGIHEARILAGMVDDPKAVSEAQIEAWVADFDSWDLCDQVCSNLFDRTPWAWDRVHAWPNRGEEFVKRAGFTLMACLAVHDKQAPDAAFLALLPLIERQSADPRNFVRKAVNWALRQIGKRNRALHRPALELAETLAASTDRTARWIGTDARRELASEKVIRRLKDQPALGRARRAMP